MASISIFAFSNRPATCTAVLVGGSFEKNSPRGQAAKRAGGPVKVAVVQEAGRDGFSVHRLLEESGAESWVVDPASIAVDRRKRRVKTDRIDVEKLLQTLIAWARGERLVCSMVHPPTVAQEDDRRLRRERGRLKKGHPTDRRSARCDRL
jgi:transposase